MASHTPGPWRVVRECMVSGSNYLTCYVYETGIGPEDVEERAANAKLIASAPTMLAALKTMVRLYHDGHYRCADRNPSGSHVCGLCEAEAAISRAVGDTK